MSKIKVADFYYGAVLSMLFSHGINPALIENSDDRQVYDFTTNKNKFRLFVKYRAMKQNTKREDYNSWLFTIAQDTSEIQSYIDNGANIILGLVCGSDNLAESELAVLDTEQIRQILVLEKSSITISRKKGERAFRISMGGGRDEALQVKCNRFEELL